MLFTALFYFLLATLLAMVEIEVEGKFGWAEKLPTWYRTKGLGKLWGILTGSRPLTGYHLWMNIFLLVFIHIGFFNGAKWTIGEELMVIARYLPMAVCWDFMWFVLNPEYGIRKFKGSEIWWHAKANWIFGLFPADYLVAFVASIILATASMILTPIGQMDIIVGHLKFLGLLLVLVAISIPNLAPLYKWWHKWMRRKDERFEANITHDGLRFYGHDIPTLGNCSLLTAALREQEAAANRPPADPANPPPPLAPPGSKAASTSQQ